MGRSKLNVTSIFTYKYTHFYTIITYNHPLSCDRGAPRILSCKEEQRFGKVDGKGDGPSERVSVVVLSKGLEEV